jgi:glycosyltransferase involved in cell wall biosynthesis
MRTGSSPPLDVCQREISDYKIPFFVAPLALPNSMLFFKICLFAFYLISTMAYSVTLFLLTLLICITKHVSLIHVHNPADLAGLVVSLVSKATRIPYIYEVHDLTPELYSETMNLSSGSFIFKIFKRIESIAVLNSEKNIVVSKTMQDHFKSSYNLNDSKFVVVYSSWSRNFLDVFKYSENELQRLCQENSLENKFVILYLGSMADGFRRGLDLLVESMRYFVYSCNLHDVRLVFVGDGEARKELEQMVKDYRLNDYVLFLGRLPRYEAYKWLRVTDVAVDPLRKVASTEIAVSNKVLEYMASGKSIVASDLIGHREVLTDGYNGLLFKSNDPMDLARKINVLATMSDENARRLGVNARRDFCEKYSWENQQQKILKLYREIVQNPRLRASCS